MEKDQLWRLGKTHIKIVSIGRHLTYFKHCKTLDEKRVTTQIESILAVQKFIKAHRGKLVSEDALEDAA